MTPNANRWPSCRTTEYDIARALRRQNDDCPIVFITSSTDFAVLGYEVQASGYLLKPLNHDAFNATMDRVAAQLDTKTPVTHLKKHQTKLKRHHGTTSWRWMPSHDRRSPVSARFTFDVPENAHQLLR